jgi:hypothetical protein
MVGICFGIVMRFCDMLGERGEEVEEFVAVCENTINFKNTLIGP